MAIRKESTSLVPSFPTQTTAHIPDVSTDGLINTPSVGRSLSLDCWTKILISNLFCSLRPTLNMTSLSSDIQILQNNGFKSLKFSAKKSTLKSPKTTKLAKMHLPPPSIPIRNPSVISLTKIFQRQHMQISKNFSKASSHPTISKPFKPKTYNHKPIPISDSVQATSGWMLETESQLHSNKLSWTDLMPKIHFYPKNLF